jgi:DNA uptake protein ComE-like DNA-binding protein
MTKKQKNFEELQTELTIKSWKDPAFKKRLMSHPKETLADMGYPVENHMEVRIIEEKPNTVTFVIKHQPKNLNLNKLNDEELKRLAAAGPPMSMTGACCA